MNLFSHSELQSLKRLSLRERILWQCWALFYKEILSANPSSEHSEEERLEREKNLKF